MCIILSLSGTILFTCFIGELAAAVCKKADIKFGCIILSLSGTILFTCFIGELAAAVRKKADIKFGVYHSPFEWYNPLYLFYRSASSGCTQEGGYQVGCVSLSL